MSDARTPEPMSRRSAAIAAIEERRRQRLAALRVRNDALLEVSAFRELLADIARRAGYFCRPPGLADEARHRMDALKDLVDGVVLHSAKGAAWLADFALDTAKQTEKQNG